MPSLSAVLSVTLRIASGCVLVLIVSGCVVSEDPMAPENWDIRIIPLVTYFPHDTTWISLDPDGLPASYCRHWDSSRCLEGARFQFDESGHLKSTERLTQGAWRKDPIQYQARFDAGGRVIAIDYFPDTASDSSAQSKVSVSPDRDTMSREFEYDSSGRLAGERTFRNGNPVDSTRYLRDADGNCIALETGTVKRREFERNESGRLTRMLVTSTTSSLQTAYRFDYRNEDVTFEPDPIWHHGLIPIWGY